MSDDAILVGDVGGTNVRFALVRAGAGGLTVSSVWKRPGADYRTFAMAMEDYLVWLGGLPRLAGASFGFAGPVSRGRVELLHRKWIIDRETVRAQLDVRDVIFANDFFAMARAAPELGAGGVDELHGGVADAEGAIAVGGPGTGFGVAILRPYAGEESGRAGWIVVGGEGGHQAFGPQTELEFRVADILRKRHGYVSNEHVASGSGFEETLDTLAQAMGLSSPGWSEQEMLAQAKAGEALAVEMCRLRARTVMTVMGNMALLSNATGGVYLAGGVTTRIAPWLREQESLDRFYHRGPRTELVAPIPIRIITSDEAPLLGAGRLWLDAQERGWL
jgi:glucokinase